MIQNCIKIAWRNLIRDRTYSFVNIIGLTIGLSSCMLLVLFAWFKLSIDTHHEKANRIYRMTNVTETANEVIERASTPVPLVQTLKEELPEVEKATHISRAKRVRIKIGQETVSVENFYWADQDFFDIFSVSVLRGNRSEYLKNPDSIVITESVANTHFRNENPLEKTIQLDSNLYTVTGVIDDWPANSHFHPQFIATFNSLSTPEDDSWFSFLTRTYFLLNENASVEEFTNKLSPVLENHFGEASWKKVTPFTPFNYWFLDDAVARQYEQYRQWLQIMGISTLMAILIACLGLFGLAGLTAVNKTKEIGVRKVLGAGVKEIVFLLNKDIVKLIGISLLIAAPISWYIMNRWLQDFAYRIDMGAGLFIWAGLASLVIALLTVSYYSVKAAFLNPVDSLRSE